MAIRGLLFDFDGLLVDTESPAYASWREIFAEHGHELDPARWAAAIGTVEGFDPLLHLEELTGATLDRDDITRRRLARKHALNDLEPLRAGVRGYLDDAVSLRLRSAIVTSDTREWIEANVARLELEHPWDLIVCADGDAVRAKPAPTMYLEALAGLDLRPDEAVAFEDSPNGIRAAKDSGLFCVAVPNPVTEGLDLSLADLRLGSLEDLSLRDLLARVEARG